MGAASCLMFLLKVYREGGNAVTFFRCATKICSVTTALEVLRTYTAQRILVVTDPYFAESGKAREIGDLVPGAQVTIFDRVVPDPTAALAAEGAALCTTLRPELLIALGGGSAIDCAKGILAAYDGRPTFIAIPTTSGSGSELTSYAVLTKDAVKHPLVEESLRPDLAILDDSLLRSLPQSLIADTGMDLMAHCVEALGATGRSGFTDALAMYAASTVLRDLRASYGGDGSVRLGLHEAASMAGAAFDYAGLGLCHAMAHALGGVFHVPHGRLCAMLLPHVMTYNAIAVLAQYAKLARQCGIAGVTDRLALRNLQAELSRLRKELHMPENLAQAGVTDSQWKQHAQDLPRAILADPCCKTNPVEVTQEGIEKILKAVGP